MFFSLWEQNLTNPFNTTVSTTIGEQLCQDVKSYCTFIDSLWTTGKYLSLDNENLNTKYNEKNYFFALEGILTFVVE